MAGIPVALLGPNAKPMPVVGLGTAEHPFNSSDVKRSVLDAIETGYRHLDTAAVYRSEPPLADAVEEAIRRGLIDSRDELFITSKLWINDAHPHLVLPALQKTLQNLRTSYVDLYLIHWPVSLKPGEIRRPSKDELLPMDFENLWKAMEECHDLGLAKSIGVSNFSSKKLDTVLSTARIPPAVNQVEMNPAWRQKKLLKYCKEKGIHVTAYSPLAAKGTPWGSNSVIDSEILKEIANNKGKSVAQVALRWIYQQGASFVVKSFSKNRMKENIEIFDFELSPEDLEKIDQIPQYKGNDGMEFTSEQGPYRSISELWDEDISGAN